MIIYVLIITLFALGLYLKNAIVRALCLMGFLSAFSLLVYHLVDENTLLYMFIIVMMIGTTSFYFEIAKQSKEVVNMNKNMFHKGALAIVYIVLTSSALILLESEKNVLTSIERYTQIVKAPIGYQLRQYIDHVPLFMFVVIGLILTHKTYEKNLKRRDD